MGRVWLLLPSPNTWLLHVPLGLRSRRWTSGELPDCEVFTAARMRPFWSATFFRLMWSSAESVPW